ncbi:vault inter-alpha-trypsin domain protein [Mycobacterium kansasii]|uniref:Vault inter-alpha-trypsin domain protein n=1 Tax=Mycobacterium kansasii TaxID=1768 RepID=A0A1V3WKD9_MYCKA|nr:vault inter-alpha-trypsin domain protein [Mycobacterium kansasii]
MSTTLLPLIPVAAAPTGRGELTSADGRRLPLKAISVDTVVVGMTATSTVRQRFVNSGETSVEATYVFPLPARAGVTDFAASLAGRRVIGVLKERAQARTDYEQALAAGQRAAIVEEDRSDVFSVRVGNLGPGEEATIELRLTGPLAFEDGEATFRFPLVVAHRYTTGTPVPGDQTGPGVARDTDAVPDASRVTPPRLADDDERPELQISLTVESAGLPVSDLRTSLPTAVLEDSADGPTRLRVEPGARPTVISCCASASTAARCRRRRCWFRMPTVMKAPGRSPWCRRPSRPARHAMWLWCWIVRGRWAAGRWSPRAERQGASWTCSTPSTGSAYWLSTTASTRPQIWRRGWSRAPTRTGSRRRRGWARCAAGRDGDGRAVAQGRGAASRLGRRPAGQRGPGDRRPDHRRGPLVAVPGPVAGRIRIYCVGIDRAVNAGFLDRLARLGRGRAELVESEARLDEAMSRLARTIGRPALTAVRVRAEGLEIVEGSTTPSRVPDAFAGVPCVVSGRYRGPVTEVTLRVEADAADGPLRAALPARVASEAVAVQTIWARSVVRDLEDDYASGRDSEGLAERLVAHSIRFGVLSRFTAFVAIDPEHTEAGPLTEVVQPVELPSGWVASAVGFLPAPAAAAARGVTAMKEAVPLAGAPAARKRALKELLKLVEKGLAGGDDSGLDEVCAELIAHRDAATDPALTAALTVLCDTLTRYLCSPTEEGALQVREAVGRSGRCCPSGASGFNGVLH